MTYLLLFCGSSSSTIFSVRYACTSLNVQSSQFHLKLVTFFTSVPSALLFCVVSRFSLALSLSFCWRFQAFDTLIAQPVWPGTVCIEKLVCGRKDLFTAATCFQNGISPVSFAPAYSSCCDDPPTPLPPPRNLTSRAVNSNDAAASPALLV